MEKLRLVETLKQEANEKFRTGTLSSISTAIQIYIDALKILESLENLKGSEEKDHLYVAIHSNDHLYVAIHSNLALCYLKTEQFQNTIDHCEKALRKDNDNMKVLYRRGQAYEKLGKYQQAADDYQNLCQLSQGSWKFALDYVFTSQKARFEGGTLPPSPVLIEKDCLPKSADHICLPFKDKLIFWGGNCKNENDASKERQVNANFLYIYWPKTRFGLRYDLGTTPFLIGGYCGVIVGEKLGIFGGVAKDVLKGAVNDNLFILDLATMRWERVETPGGGIEGRLFHSGWEYGGKFWFFGGVNHRSLNNITDTFDPSEYLNSVICYDPAGRCWSKPETWGAIPEPRIRHTTTSLGDGRVLLFGGAYFTGQFNDIHILHMDTLTWTRLEPRGTRIPSARFYHVAAYCQGSLVVHGGCRTVYVDVEPGQNLANSTTSTAHNDELLLFDLKKSKWRLLETCSQIGALMNHTAATVGSEVYFFGGRSLIPGLPGTQFPGKLHSFGMKVGQQEGCGLSKESGELVEKLKNQTKHKPIDVKVADLRCALDFLNL